MSEILDHCPAITAIHKSRVRSYLRQPEEIEHLHQLRVQSRRILSHLSKEAPLYRQLKETMKKSNPIRDIDVLMADTLPTFPKELRKKIKNSGLIEKIKKVKEEKEAILRQFLFETEYNYEDFLFFQLVEEEASKEAAPKIAKSAKANVPKPSCSLDSSIELMSLPERDVHRFRIKVKKERYTAEHHPEPNKSLVGILKKMQEALGKFNDYCVFAETLQHYKVDKKILSAVQHYLQDEKNHQLEKCQTQIINLRAFSE